MAKEIERKFLVKPGYKPSGKGVKLVQGYLPTSGGFTARVRLTGAKAFLTLKGPSQGFSRDEYEYPLPAKDAKELLERYCAGRVVSKTRHAIRFSGFVWEVDLFEGANKGLRMAEIELPSAKTKFITPPWVGKEVTGDRRFDNSRLAVSPYKPEPEAKSPGQLDLLK